MLLMANDLQVNYHYDLEALVGEVGGFGRYQKFFYILLCLPAVFCASISFSNAFVTASPAARCFIPGCDDRTDDSYKDAFDSRYGNFANFSIPLRRGKNGSDSYYSSCEFHPLVDSSDKATECKPENFNSTEVSACHTYVFDDASYGKTAVVVWNLVCDNAWKDPLIESVYFFGVLTSALTFGLIADRYGRKRAIMFSLLITSLTSIPLALTPSYKLFLGLQFLMAFGQLGVFQSCFVLGVELVSEKWRDFCGIVIEFFFVVGEVYVAGVAYIFRSDLKRVILAATCPMIVFLLYWPFLPESFRWLVERRKYALADRELRRIARYNRGNDFHLNLDSFKKMTRTNASAPLAVVNENLLDLFRCRTTLVRLLNLAYAWFVVSMTFYGLSLNTSTLVNGDPYLNFILVALAEIPGYISSFYLMRKVGRRWAAAAGLLLGGSACLVDGLKALILVKYDRGNNTSMDWISVAIFLVGKIGITSAFGTIYLYTSELLPTSVRTAAVGTCSTFGRVGAILSPFIATLNRYGSCLPLVIFGASAVVSGLLALLLPETKGRVLPETVKDAAALGNATRHDYEPIHTDDETDLDSSSSEVSETLEEVAV